MKTIPVPVTITIVLISILAAVFPSLTSLLELDFQRAAQGEIWRWISGHVVHFDWSHFFWDVSMFATLSAICESKYRRVYAPILIGSMLIISLSLAIVCPEIHCYRGLSGIDTMLFGWWVIDWMRTNLHAKDLPAAGLGGMMLLGLVGKLGYEAVFHQTLFVQSDAFVPLVEAHIAGLICGATAALGVPVVQNWTRVRQPVSV
ncbi:rhombosortase [Rosistilla oblonga]|uniref:Peptidase S54 rhomboid domain-containing protein n=1 Tax=Rosistilla oblonga TaxID=2527990 RepID=A0A518INK9_9BACT|nr:rhombosortase [Rosistilla oblonga]QDV54676.1 hypothetical protein Mal33_06310 [Rosistilla oblonga]